MSLSGDRTRPSLALIDEPYPDSSWASGPWVDAPATTPEPEPEPEPEPPPGNGDNGEPETRAAPAKRSRRAK